MFILFFNNNNLFSSFHFFSIFLACTKCGLHITRLFGSSVSFKKTKRQKKRKRKRVGGRITSEYRLVFIKIKNIFSIKSIIYKFYRNSKRRGILFGMTKRHHLKVICKLTRFCFSFLNVTFDLTIIQYVNRAGQSLMSK